MANDTERKYSLTISIRINSISASDAQKLEDTIRDAADDYGAQVSATKDAERPAPANR